MDSGGSLRGVGVIRLQRSTVKGNLLLDCFIWIVKQRRSRQIVCLDTERTYACVRAFLRVPIVQTS